MKPDLGWCLHDEGMRPDLRRVFYDVPIDHLTLTDPPGLTTMVTKVHAGQEFAVSFDFTDEAAAQVVAAAPEGIIAALEAAATAGDVRGRTVNLNPPLRMTLEATLGPLQQSPNEVFAPLIVHRAVASSAGGDA